MFSFRIATIEDAQKIHWAMQTVADSMEDKSLFVCDDFEFVKSHISDKGFIVVATTQEAGEDRIVGCLIVRYPGDESDNLGLDIGLPKSELYNVVHMESAVVLPKYRGNGLENKMMKYADEQIENSDTKHFMSTASPDNIASCKSLEKCGYVIKMTKQKYGGIIRHIYYRHG